MSVSQAQHSDLLCKNECGFYGNPSWDGYCSVCYRETYIQQGQSRNLTTNITNASAQAFSRFEAKRKQLVGKGANTMKNIFRFTKDDARDKSNNLPEECYQAGSDFNQFLGSIKPAVSADISRLVSKLLEELETMGGSHINQYSVVIQNFYQNVSARIAKSPLYSGLPVGTTERLNNAIERFLTTWIYCWAFASPITDDEAVDLRLQEKIRSLHWVTPGLLGSPIDTTSKAEMDCLDTATLALIRVNALYASADKLDEVVQCCMHVFDALKEHGKASLLSRSTRDSSSGTEAGSSKPTDEEAEMRLEASANADDFLPTLIWVVLTANPPLLHSNLQFIMRFANQKCLNSGKAAYCFTNLSCAVHFLTNLTYESLNMTEQEFYRCMRTGMPLVRPRHGHMCEGEQAVADNELRLLDLTDKLNDFDNKLTTAERELQDHDQKTQASLERIHAQCAPAQAIKNILDPRHLETPHVLLLGPRPPPSTQNQQPTGSQVPSLLDTDVDESVSHLLPQPITPSPFP